MKKEYPSTPDEAFEVNTQGLYYAQYINTARTQKRICNIPYDRTLKVHTSWDLGFTDTNCIIFFQIAGKEIHCIDFVEGSGYSMADYIKMVKDKPYVYGTHIAPHDIKVHEYSTGAARIDTADKLGIHFILAPDLSKIDGIDAVRNIFPKLWFHHSEQVMNLVHHIENYTQRWDKSLGQWSGQPQKDGHDHAADSLRYLAISLDYCENEGGGISQQEADNLWRTHGRKI